ncbi:MAG: LysM domain-containing protein [Candidatus Thiodiazotropha sp. 6PLUC2]
MVDSVSNSKNSSSTSSNKSSSDNSPAAESHSSKSDEMTTEERLKSLPSALDRALGDNSRHGGDATRQETGYGTQRLEEVSSSVTDKADKIVDDTLAAATDGVKTVQVDEAFDKLNSDGDKLYMRVTAEVKGNIQIGLKGQLGGDIEVTQLGEGADAEYRVSLDKESLAAFTQKVSIPYVPLKFEEGLQTADRVEMTFANRDEAIQATTLLQRLAVADVASDLSGAAGVLSGAGANPVANPLTESGSPGVVTTAAVGLSGEDMAFLQGHISAYETTLGVRGRAALELQAPQLFLPFQVQGEGRLDPRIEVTRRVELPEDGKPGELTYTVSGDVRASAKEKLAFDPIPTNQFDAGVMLQNRLEIGSARIEVSANYDLPAGDITTSPVGGRVVPEYDLVTGDGFGAPDRISVETSAEWRTQGVLDASRGDSNKTVANFEINNPEQAGPALSMLANGDVTAAASAAGVELKTTFQQIERSGLATQGGFKFKFGEGNELEVTVIVEAGVDDVTTMQHNTIAPQQTAPVKQPVDDGKTLVVEPEAGLTLRNEPMGKRTSVFQHGTFLRQTGEAVTAFDGNQWVPVEGTDVNDQPVSGYVYAGYIRSHDSGSGAMDETGRTNPTLEYQRYDQLTVKDGDNLWDLAQQHNVSFEEMVELNNEHLIAPELIFAGDTVYLPGTEKGPIKVAEVETQELPANTSTSTPGSGSSTESSSTSLPAGSGSLSGSGSTSMTDSTSTPTNSDSSSSSTGSANDASLPGAEVEAGNAPAGTDQIDDRKPMSEILEQYQVTDDAVLPEWQLEVKVGPLTIERVPFTNIEVPILEDRTRTETDLIQQLYDREGFFAVKTFNDIVNPQGTDQEINAYRIADQKFSQFDDKGKFVKGGEDGHNDAMRHSFYSAMLTKEFGVGFAESFATAHEGVPGNPADREAMDLFNNELGRRIAVENPKATPRELAGLIYNAILNGEAVVIDGKGELVYSDQVAVGQTGKAHLEPINGVQTPPEWLDTGSN